MKDIFLVLEAEQTDMRRLLQMGEKARMTEEHIVLLLYNLVCGI